MVTRFHENRKLHMLVRHAKEGMRYAISCITLHFHTNAANTNDLVAALQRSKPHDALANLMLTDRLGKQYEWLLAKLVMVQRFGKEHI